MHCHFGLYSFTGLRFVQIFVIVDNSFTNVVTESCFFYPGVLHRGIEFAFSTKCWYFCLIEISQNKESNEIEELLSLHSMKDIYYNGC